ncbi:hypothetical protein [Caulobacter sp. UC70_42]|uniref:hypothetical protein n=1 Tax=Caulobacter sp. UC70_42 TaxID=3374551 RepID=UPI00375692A5
MPPLTEPPLDDADEVVIAASSWASSFCIRSAAAVEPEIRLARVEGASVPVDLPCSSMAANSPPLSVPSPS